MKVLAITTSTSNGEICGLDNLNLIDCGCWQNQKSHGEVATAAIEKMIKAGTVVLADLEGVAIDVGPGSFTGIRIGVNIARTLAYYRNIPVFPCSSLYLLAENVPLQQRNLPIVVLINAFRNMVYCATYIMTTAGLKAVLDPQALTVAGLEAQITSPHLCVGDGYAVYAKFFSEELRKNLIRFDGADYPSAQVLGRLAVNGHLQSLDWKQLKPLYIRSSAAEENNVSN